MPLERAVLSTLGLLNSSIIDQTLVYLYTMIQQWTSATKVKSYLIGTRRHICSVNHTFAGYFRTRGISGHGVFSDTRGFCFSLDSDN